MYKVSPEAEKVLLSPSRTIRPYGYIGNYILNESNVIDFNIERILSNNGIPGIGGAIAAKLELTLVKEEIPQISKKPINIGIEVLVNDIFERIPLGTFFPSIDSIKKTEQTLKVECFDRMAEYEKINYTTRLSYPMKIKQMCIELQERFNVSFANIESIPDNLIYNDIPMLNIRSILGEIAELLGANALMNRFDQVEFVTLSKEPAMTITADNYIEFLYSSEDKVMLAKLSCTGKNLTRKIVIPNKEEELIDGIELTFTNDSIKTEKELQRIYDVFMPLTYQAYEMKLQGMPHVDVGDKITVINKQGNVIDIFVINNKLTYSGGLISEWSNEAPDSDVVETGSTGSTAITDRIEEVLDSNETVIHFENNKEIVINSSLTEIARTSLALTSETEAILHFTAIIKSSSPATIFFEITNNDFLFPFQPVQSIITGYNTVSFTMPLLQLDYEKLNLLSVKIRTGSVSETAVIEPRGAQIIVRGKYLLGNTGPGLPSADVIEEVVYTSINVSDTVSISHQTPIRRGITDNVTFTDLNVTDNYSILFDIDYTDEAPAMPCGVQVTIGINAFNITWEANTEEFLAGYNVYVDGVKLNREVIFGTSYDVTGLKPGMAYQVKLTAVSIWGVESEPYEIVVELPEFEGRLYGLSDMLTEDEYNLFVDFIETEKNNFQYFYELHYNSYKRIVAVDGNAGGFYQSGSKIYFVNGTFQYKTIRQDGTVDSYYDDFSYSGTMIIYQKELTVW